MYRREKILTRSTDIRVCADFMRFAAMFWLVFSLISCGKELPKEVLRESKTAGSLDLKSVPDVLVRTVAGDTVRLSKLYKQAPMLLSVYLGVGCPMCVMSMKQLSQHAYRFRSYGWNVVGLSNDTPEDNRTALAEPNLDSSFVQPGGKFEIDLLSDSNHLAMEALGCYRRQLDTERHGMFLIDTAGFIRFERIDKRPFQDWAMLTDSMKAVFVSKNAKR